MATDVATELTFAGSPKDREAASQVFKALAARGRFMSDNAPIRVPVAHVAAYLDAQGIKGGETKVRAIAEDNPGVFLLQGEGDAMVIVTSKAGRTPVLAEPPAVHTFKQRFMTPKPKSAAPVIPVRERARIDERWTTLVIDPSLIAADTDYEEEVEAVAETIAEIEQVIEAIEPVAELELEIEEVAAAASPSRTITSPVITPTDVTGVDDVELATAIRERLTSDPRVAVFGEQWMMEDRVPRFSRGDLRRVREYIQEQEQPLTDDAIVQDVFNVRVGSPDFELNRFAVNFRLSREKDFEFVGTGNQRFWSTTGLAPIGTTRRKPNELGSDYRYLLDETPAHIAYRSVDKVDHILTFFEFAHGLLPYDADLQRLLPMPVEDGQRAAVLTFECPQSYTTYLVELRFPTPNRGGFVLGLDDFFSENLVPGAHVTISRTENDGHYRVEYIAESSQSERLLELEERKSRYVFRPTTFACSADPAMLLTETMFGRLNGEKPLDEKVRKRPEAVVAATFERVGESRDGNFSASFATLLAGVNIERPMSAHLLRETLDKDDTGAFSRDPDLDDAYTYVPGTTP